MKAKAIFLILFLLSFLVLRAQEKERRHEISAGYGIVTSDEAMGVTSSLLTTILTLANANRTNMHWTGLYHLGYKFRAGRIFPLGISVGYEKMTSDLTNKDQEVVGKEKGQYISIMAEGSVRYLNKRVFQMYSGLAAGYTLASSEVVAETGEESDTDHFNHFNFQVNVIGVRLGGIIGGFLELGFGYKGLINFGISCQF